MTTSILSRRAAPLAPDDIAHIMPSNPVRTCRSEIKWAVASALTAALALCAQSTWAAPAPPPASGGQLLQQVPAVPPPANTSTPEVTITRPEAGRSASTQTFTVKHIEVAGNTAVPSTDIRRLVAPSEGKTLTLGDLQKLADSIAELYHKRGYPFAQAYVPAQTIQDGNVKITVLEARYDSIVLRNRSRVRDAVAHTALSGLKVGQPVDQASLDRALLLLSDLPSTQVKGTLRPGQTPGASQLLVDVDPAAAMNGSVSLDDDGNAATGRARLGASVNFDNPLRAGDVLSLSALTAGRGMSYGRVGYDLPLYGPATRLEAHVSTLDYKVVNGAESDLDILGTARIYGLGLQQSLLRSTATNIVANLGYEETRLNDEVDATDIHTDRRTKDWHLSVSAGATDHWGATNFSAGLTLGRVDFDNPTALLIDQSSARTDGRFTRYDFNLSRLQRLTDRTSLYGSVSYQGANSNLDVSEQFFVGGPNSVRAYDNGVAAGSQGNSQTLELRQELAANSVARWEGTLFLDHAQIQLEKDRYSAGENTADLSGVGVGVNMVAAHGWSLTSAVATPIGSIPEAVGHRGSVRVWATVVKLF